MPLTHFVDDELVEELKNIKKTDNENDNLEESRFIENFLRTVKLILQTKMFVI